MAGQKQTASSFKKKLMYVGSNHSLAKINHEFPVMISDQPIPRVQLISCLGVKLDETLNWEEYIGMVCKKVGTGRRNFKAYQALCSCNHFDINL